MCFIQKKGASPPPGHQPWTPGGLTVPLIPPAAKKNDVSIFFQDYPLSTQWNLLNEVYLLSIFDVSSFSIIDFQTGHFANFEQFKIDSHFANFGKVNINPNCLFLVTLDRLQLFYWAWVRLRLWKAIQTCLTKNSRTMHRIWHKQFSTIQSAEIKKSRFPS